MDLTIKIDRIPAEGRDLRGLLDASRLREILGLGTEAGLDTPSGAEVALHVDKIERAVRVTGRVVTAVAGACARCLTEVRHPIEGRVDLTLFPARPGEEAAEEAALERRFPTLDDPGVQSGVYSGLVFDLTSTLRELILLELPMRLLCDDGCAGLCGLCGKNLNEGPCACVSDDVDPRWAKLKELKVS